MNNIKISIITINYNNKSGLQKTLDSVLAQTCKDFEWIVIDGGSTDGSRELIERHKDAMAYWCSEPDRGIYHAMNKGIEKAKGDYLQFLNSGDSFANSEVVSCFLHSHPLSDVVYGDAIIVDENDLVIGTFVAPNFIRLSYFWSHSINHQATFFHQRCFKTIRYDENLKIASDVELYMQLLINGFIFEKIDLTIVRYANFGISTQIVEGEFNKIIDKILPVGVKADYEDIIQFRDVDLAIMIRKIIASNRLVRNVARIILYPIYLLIK